MEVVEDKVEERGSGGGGAVDFAGLVDLRARVAGFGDLRGEGGKWRILFLISDCRVQ